jgi:hypothetical protein
MLDGVPLYPVNRAHLDVMTDGVGIMQHATGRRPDPAHGYCTDDVARALRVDLLHQRELGWRAVEAGAWRGLRFIEEALDPATGRFRNFRRIDGSWLEETGSEDCHGRTMLALGEAMARAPDERLAELARRLFARALPAARELGALRAQASVLLACDAAVRAVPNGPTMLAYRLIAGRLRSAFGSRPDGVWPWPEERLTYENALLPEALIVAGGRLGSRPMLDLGLRVLDWLIDVQTGASGNLSPVGNGWWPRGGDRSQFDQQPIEATSLMLAAESAYLATGDARYLAAMERAYAWFLGGNDLGVPVADPERGASFDGLTPGGVNENQGAESTLMWLLALEHIRALRTGQVRATAPDDRAVTTSVA